MRKDELATTCGWRARPSVHPAQVADSNFSLCFVQVSFSDWFISHGGSRASITRMWDPIAYALGFIDCDNISARCMLTIFQFFATKTEASVLRMLAGEAPPPNPLALLVCPK